MKSTLWRQQRDLILISTFISGIILIGGALWDGLYGAKQVGYGVLLGQASWICNGMLVWLLFTKKHIASIALVTVIKYLFLIVIILLAVKSNNLAAVVGLVSQISGTGLAWYFFKIHRSPLNDETVG